MHAKDTEDNAKDIEDKDNAKDTEMSNKTTIQGHHSSGLQTCMLQLSPGLFHQGTANPTNWLYSAWGICGLCEWIYVCPGFQVRSLCVILGLCLSYTHYLWLSINSTFRSARVSCSAPSLKCYSISPAWLTHLPISTIVHVTHSPQAC